MTDEEKNIIKFLRALTRVTKRYGMFFSAGPDDINIYDATQIRGEEIAAPLIYDREEQKYYTYVGSRAKGYRRVE